jgi:hypothetical protein
VENKTFSAHNKLYCTLDPRGCQSRTTEWEGGGGVVHLAIGPSEVPRELFSSAGTNTMFDIMYIYIYAGALNQYDRIINHF